MGNVVPLFKDKRAPLATTGTLSGVMNSFIEFAEKQGVDTRSQKFLYECASIMTLMQCAITR